MSDLGWPLARAARLRGEETAVRDAGRTVSYAELARRVAGLGGALDALGVAPGARVGFLGANSLAHLECWLGVPAYGRVIVDLNFRLVEDELAFMASDCDVEVLLADSERLPVAQALASRCDALRQVIEIGPEYEALVAGEPAAAPGVDENAPATISYTGGTTGAAKGVVLSHRNLLANALHNLAATGHSADDRWLHVCPMFHVAGTANVLACTWVGGEQVILPRFDADAVADTLAGEAITHTVLVPTMLAMLLDRLERAPVDLGALRHIQYAASPISPELQRRALAMLDCDLAQFYGMTEAAPTVTHLTPADHRRGGERLGSMGTAVAGVEAVVRGPGGEELPPGEIGEVWVRGPNVMLGYWNRPDATAEALVDGGWYRSGDAAYADARGYLFLVDRLKEMIVSGGENVYSIEVEAVLAGHPDVLEAAVFGIPDERWGEAVHAVVSLRPGVASVDLVEYCRGRIAGYKIPRSVSVSDGPLPKSGAGKVLKSVLREPWWEGRTRRVS